MNEQNISQSLKQLSQAIGQLADIVNLDASKNNTSQVKKLSYLVDTFSESTQRLEEKATQTPNISLESKHKKNFLENWLHDKRIYTGRSINRLGVDDKLFRVADFLADHYKQLEVFYADLKRHQNFKEDFISHPKRNAVRYIKTWLNLLRDNEIIDSFQMLNKNKIDVDIAEIHKATLFISGNWLEIFLRKEIALLLHRFQNQIHSFDILAQVELVKPDKTNSELDLLLMINNEIFWFECKTGSIGSYYNRFEKHRKLLGLDTEHSFIVVPDKNAQNERTAMKRSGMSMLYATDIERQLRRVLFDS